MDQREKAERLKSFLKQIAPSGDVESLLPQGVQANESVAEAAGAGGVHANLRRGLEKVAEGRHEQLTLPEMLGLEAIVLKENRPAAYVRDGSFDDLPPPWTALNAPDVKKRINSLLPLIGRVEVPNSPILPYAGTGFVVGQDLIATNRHVAQLFAQGLGMAIRYHPGDAAFNPLREVDSQARDASAQLQVLGVEMIHPYWDMAILRVTGLPRTGGLSLSTKRPEDLINRNVVVIGYPARDDRNDLDLQDRIYDGTYLVKRLQPGVMRQRATIQSFENRVSALTHDAATLGGCSGSAVIDVDSGEVVGLHFAGVYLKANYAVPTYEMARDTHISSRLSAKLNFDGSVEATDAWDSAWRRVEQEELTPKTTSTTPTGKPMPRPISANEPSAPDEHSWTIPIKVTVSLGKPEAETQIQASVPLNDEEGVVVDQDYSDRQGYDDEFLGDVAVPLPTLTAAMKKDTAVVTADAQLDGDKYALAYYHYTVYMNKRRRTAWFSAANVDGKQRPNIGKRQGDRWYVDTRIDKAEQLSQAAFEHGIDRGHLTRREDTAWGKDVDSATRANNDTFHFTNCSLQASPFNRGKDRWQGLEQFLLEQHAKKDKRRMIVMTGPLFAPNDPVYQNPKMDYSVRCPLQFWKVCVLIRESDGKPSATGFILGQEDIQNLPGFEEAFDVAATQIKIKDLEQKTGLNFGAIKKYDHFAGGGAAGTLEVPQLDGSKHSAKVIQEGKDIVV